MVGKRFRARRWYAGALALLIAALPLVAACGYGAGKYVYEAGTATALAGAPAAAKAYQGIAVGDTGIHALAAAPAPATTNVYLTIVTGGMIGKKDWPAYVPANFTVPANATVTVHVVNFDTASDISATPQYAKVSGTVGNSETVQPISKTDPNDPGPAHTYTGLNPKDGVAHTFTVAQLGLNVPIAPESVTSFTFKTGKAGTYSWRCWDPCGTGASGWGGPMATPNYMEGTITVA